MFLLKSLNKHVLTLSCRKDNALYKYCICLFCGIHRSCICSVISSVIQLARYRREAFSFCQILSRCSQHALQIGTAIHSSVSELALNSKYTENGTLLPNREKKKRIYIAKNAQRIYTHFITFKWSNNPLQTTVSFHTTKCKIKSSATLIVVNSVIVIYFVDY